MYEEEFCIKRTSEMVATIFDIRHEIIMAWIRNGLKRQPLLSPSFELEELPNKKKFYWIDEAGYEYLCNRYKNIKLATRESVFREDLIPFMSEMGYSVECQKIVLGYRVDFYIPQLNLVIEYDEEYHRLKKVSEYDKIRESDIVNELNCCFLRIPSDYGSIRALGVVASTIVKIRITSDPATWKEEFYDITKRA